MSNSTGSLELELIKRFKGSVWETAKLKPHEVGTEKWWMKLIKAMETFLVQDKNRQDPSIEAITNVISLFARDLIKDQDFNFSGQAHDVVEFISNDVSNLMIESVSELIFDTLYRTVSHEPIPTDPKPKKSFFSCCTRPWK